MKRHFQQFGLVLAAVAMMALFSHHLHLDRDSGATHGSHTCVVCKTQPVPAHVQADIGRPVSISSELIAVLSAPNYSDFPFLIYNSRAPPFA